MFIQCDYKLPVNLQGDSSVAENTKEGSYENSCRNASLASHTRLTEHLDTTPGKSEIKLY